MINSFSVTPKPQNNNSKIFMSVFFVIAAASVIVSLFLDTYKGVVGMVTLLSLTTAILIYTKFVAVVFHYDIFTDGEDEPLFVIRQTVGKKQATLCRVAFADFVKIDKETREERRAHKTDFKSARYVYTPTLSPDESYRIYVSSRHEKAEIIAELDEEFVSVLTSALPEAREIRALENDE